MTFDGIVAVVDQLLGGVVGDRPGQQLSGVLEDQAQPRGQREPVLGAGHGRHLADRLGAGRDGPAAGPGRLEPGVAGEHLLAEVAGRPDPGPEPPVVGLERRDGRGVEAVVHREDGRVRGDQEVLVGQPAARGRVDDAGDAVAVPGHAGGRPALAAGDDHHRLLPGQVETVEPVDQPVRQVHAEEEERRDHDPVDRHGQVVRRSVQVVAPDIGGGEVVVVLERPLEEPLGRAAGVVDHLADRLFAAGERRDLDPVAPQGRRVRRACSRAASSSSWQLAAHSPCGSVSLIRASEATAGPRWEIAVSSLNPRVERRKASTVGACPWPG